MRALLLIAFVLLPSCGDDRPPAPTAAENAQLDDAGNMLDELANAEANGS